MNNVCYSWCLGAPSPKLYLFGWKLDPVSKNHIFPWTLVLTRLWLQSRAKLCPWDLALVKCCQMSFGRLCLVRRELSILGAARWAPAVMVTNFWHTSRGCHVYSEEARRHSQLLVYEAASTGTADFTWVPFIAPCCRTKHVGNRWPHPYKTPG